MKRFYYILILLPFAGLSMPGLIKDVQKIKDGGRMFIKTLSVGPLQTNCYIVADEKSKKAMVVDPGDEPDRIMDIVKENGLTVEHIILTHAHFDHVGAAPDIKKETGAKIALNKLELPLYNAATDQAAVWGYEVDPLPPPDMFLEEGEEIKVGGLVFKVLHTPGHSPGGICLFGEGVVITGDTLFAGSVGRTDFPGGDVNKLKTSFKRLLGLPASTEVLPGHGPSSTIKEERTGNFFNDML